MVIRKFTGLAAVGAVILGLLLPTSAAAADYRPGAFEPLSTRVLDTRSEEALAPGDVLNGTVWLGHSVPARPVAAVLNITAVGATGSGFLTAGAGDSPQPATSNLNYKGPGAVSNLTTVRVNTAGWFRIWNAAGGTPVHVVVDLVGYYDEHSGRRYAAIDPLRVLDTRSTPGGPPAAGCATKVPVPHGWVPSDATHLALNVTATAPRGPGYLTVDTGLRTSNLNFTTGQTIANQVIAPIGADGMVTICNSTPVHVVADLVGYYGRYAGSLLYPQDPTRLYDTRTAGNGPIAAGGTLSLGPAAPAGATAALLNVTAVQPTATGYLTVWGHTYQRPGTSTLNFTPGAVVPNHVQTPVDSARTVFVYNSGGSTHVVVDSFGYFAPTPADWPPAD
ncbi:hypothetical protein F4556_002506 [Kitasatospora gansuensis]|uniref:Uncharacterized protein n=1 Tax=Kitasatospora gansuensis TaxID=258050 RepID=A0A7W7SAM0_9ACTN|nr:hypothetical protein [Kitasatospora gansuensis]MBB4946971.1 hypothetical protein [Kitasatospora gansuensis]